MRHASTFVLLLGIGLIAAVLSPESAGQQKAKQKGKGKGGGLFSNTVRVGDTLWVSGKGSQIPGGQGKHPEGMEAATRQAMMSVQSALENGGFTLADVVASYVWITDVGKFAEMNKAYRTFFKDQFPTRTTVQVTTLPGGSTVEIAAVAVKGPKQVIHPAGAKPRDVPLSPGILVGDSLYLSGQISMDPKTGQLVEGDIKAHVNQTLKNLEGVLQAAGMDFGNVVSTYVFLTNVEDFSGMNEAYHAVTKDPRPARVTVGVPALARKGAPVEITMIAKRQKGQAVLPADMKPSQNYSRGLLADHTLYVSGVGSAKPTVTEQVDDCMGRVEKIVKEAGMTMQDLTEARVYLTDIKDYNEMNKAYRQHFNFPNSATRATMAVAQLPIKYKIMMAFVGAKQEK